MPGVTRPVRLQLGYAVATTSLNVLGHHCNPVISAETAMMTKERLIETVGPIRYTLSTGGSGGAIGQLQVSQAYPGHHERTDAVADVPGRLDHRDGSRRLPAHGGLLAQEPDVHAPPEVGRRRPRSPRSSCAAWLALFVPTGIPSHGCFGGQSIPAANVAVFEPARDYSPVVNPEAAAPP